MGGTNRSLRGRGARGALLAIALAALAAGASGCWPAYAHPRDVWDSSLAPGSAPAGRIALAGRTAEAAPRGVLPADGVRLARSRGAAAEETTP